MNRYAILVKEDGLYLIQDMPENKISPSHSNVDDVNAYQKAVKAAKSSAVRIDKSADLEVNLIISEQHPKTANTADQIYWIETEGEFKILPDARFFINEGKENNEYVAYFIPKEQEREEEFAIPPPRPILFNRPFISSPVIEQPEKCPTCFNVKNISPCFCSNSFHLSVVEPVTEQEREVREKEEIGVLDTQPEVGEWLKTVTEEMYNNVSVLRRAVFHNPGTKGKMILARALEAAANHPIETLVEQTSNPVVESLLNQLTAARQTVEIERSHLNGIISMLESELSELRRQLAFYQDKNQNQ